MKKSLGIAAFLAVALTLFSFSTKDVKKADYKVLDKAIIIKAPTAGSFTQYQSHHYTSGQGTWNYRREVWNLTEAVAENVNEIEKVINN